MLLAVKQVSVQNGEGEIVAGRAPCGPRISMEEICNGEWTIGGPVVRDEAHALNRDNK